MRLCAQARLPASCRPSCGVRLQASLSQFSVTPAGGSAGVWIRTAWSSTGPDKTGNLAAVSLFSRVGVKSAAWCCSSECLGVAGALWAVSSLC